MTTPHDKIANAAARAGLEFGPAMARDRLHRWTSGCPPVEARRLLRIHGYKDPARVRPVITETAERISALAAEIIELEACYQRFPVTACANGELHLQTGTVFHCPAFDRLFGGCDEVIAFVMTLGASFDRKVIDYIDAFEPLEALFMETSGWLSIEAATRRLGGFLRSALQAEGRRIAHRMGPGYNYRAEEHDSTGEAEGESDNDADGEDAGRKDGRVEWPLPEQRQLFDLFGDARLPVELTEACVMKPKMSRSGLFGIEPPARS